MKKSLIQKIIWMSVIVISANGFIAWAIYLNNSRFVNHDQLIQGSEQILLHSNRILSYTRDIETGAHGFVITKDKAFLVPLYKARQIIFVHLGQIRKLSIANPNLKKRVDSLDYYVRKRLVHSLKMIEIRSKSGLDSSIAFVANNQGQNYTDSIREITSLINANEEQIISNNKKSKVQTASLFNHYSTALFLVMFFFTILMLFGVANYLIQNDSKIKRAEELELVNKELACQNIEKERQSRELVASNMELESTKSNLNDHIKGLEEMMFMTSHKVRQPIANILGLSNLLEGSQNTVVEVKMILGFIRQSAVKLDLFTKELTEFMTQLNRKRRK